MSACQGLAGEWGVMADMFEGSFKGHGKVLKLDYVTIAQF